MVNVSSQHGEDSESQSLHQLSELNKSTVEEAMKLMMEQQKKAHQQSVLQWKLKRRERKQ